MALQYSIFLELTGSINIAGGHKAELIITYSGLSKKSLTQICYLDLVLSTFT